MKDGRARPRNQPGVKQKVLMAQKPKQSFPGVIALKEVILVIGVTKVISKVMDGEIKPQIHLGDSTNVPLAHKTKQTVSGVMALKEVTLVRHCYILIQYLAATWKKGLFLDKVDRLRNFFWSNLGRGTQKRDKSVIKAIESMARPKDLTKYRGYTLLQKQGWDSTKVDDASKGPVVPQLTAVQGSGLGNTPLGFATSNIQNVQASVNNQIKHKIKLATMIRLDTNGKCNVIPVPDTLNLKVSEKKHLQYIFEAEYPELFCSKKVKNVY